MQAPILTEQLERFLACTGIGGTGIGGIGDIQDYFASAGATGLPGNPRVAGQAAEATMRLAMRLRVSCQSLASSRRAPDTLAHMSMCLFCPAQTMRESADAAKRHMLMAAPRGHLTGSRLGAAWETAQDIDHPAATQRNTITHGTGTFSAIPLRPRTTASRSCT
jgi:hypothetical protein